MLTQGATVRRMMKRAAAFGLSLVLAAAGLFAASLFMACLLAAPAEARHRAHAHHAAREYRHYFPRRFAHERHATHSLRYSRAQISAPSRNFAAIVVDGNSGRTLYARNEDEPRHPASITKVMTLYLLFEQLEHGRLSLDSQLRVSAHAAAQKPTKLGLRPGATIMVEDAIKAVVTRSANDMAVAIAEAIGGDEEHFAELMTRKAQELGMSRTRFVNASGLPDDAQITTARDLAILGRAVQERFPRYYHYFSTHAFYYAGATILNHNHLLDRVEGMDGIKTGYTRASGFNLLTSVKRDGHYIVAAVMGGVSAGLTGPHHGGSDRRPDRRWGDGPDGVGDPGQCRRPTCPPGVRSGRSRRRTCRSGRKRNRKSRPIPSTRAAGSRIRRAGNRRLKRDDEDYAQGPSVKSSGPSRSGSPRLDRARRSGRQTTAGLCFGAPSGTASTPPPKKKPPPSNPSAAKTAALDDRPCSPPMQPPRSNAVDDAMDRRAAGKRPQGYRKASERGPASAAAIQPTASRPRLRAVPPPPAPDG